MSGTTLEVNGDTVENATVATDEAVQTPATNVGTPFANFSVFYNNCMVQFYANVPFIADAGLYALLGGSTSTLVTWND